MGGIGSSRGLDPDELEALEKRVRQSLKERVDEHRRNVFISFSSDDLSEVNLLRAQAKNQNSNLNFNDWSLRKPFNSEAADYIKRGIRDRIRQSSVTVVYVSDNTVSSKWVDWEIRQSLALGKGVVAMHKGNISPRRLPKAIVENKIRVVQWSQDHLARIIEGESESR